MRKTILASIAVLAVLLAPAASAQFRYGPMAGFSMTNLKFKQDLVSVEKTPGFAAGVVAEMMFPGIGFGIDLGLYYDMRGAKLGLGEKEIWSSQGYGTEHMTLHYIALPFHLRFKYTNLNGFEEKIAPLVYAGPTFGFHVANSNIKAFQYSGGDLGLEFGVGAEVLRHWQITGSYTMGMTYVTKAKVLTNYSARSNSWNVRISYLF